MCVYFCNGMLVIKKILPFATTWVNLQGFMLTSISQKKTNAISLYVALKKLNKQNEIRFIENEWAVFRD